MPPPHPAAEAPIRILVVDDDPLVLRVECMALERAGFKALAASNRSEAIRFFAAHGHQIDLAVIDVSVPGDNGFEIASCLNEMRPSLKTLFVSGYPEESLALKHGVDLTGMNLLLKPFLPAEFVAAVRERLRPSAVGRC